MKTSLLILFLTATSWASPALAKVDLPAVVKDLQKTWSGIQTFKTPFKQTVHSKFMGTDEESTGSISVIKPDKFRWESLTDGTTQIINGKKLTLVQPKAQRGRTVVDIYRDFTKHAQIKFLDFLAGTVQIDTLYTPKLLKEKDKTIEIQLIPKKKGTDPYVAEIDKKSYLLRALTYESDETKTRLEFSDPKRNEKLEPKLFEYQPKKNDIVQYH